MSLVLSDPEKNPDETKPVKTGQNRFRFKSDASFIFSSYSFLSINRMPDILLHQFLLFPQTGRFPEIGRWFVRPRPVQRTLLGSSRLRKFKSLSSFYGEFIFEPLLSKLSKTCHQVAQSSTFSMATRWC